MPLLTLQGINRLKCWAISRLTWTAQLQQIRIYCLTDDLTITGGQAVDLALTSEECQGGQQGDSVRFAPDGYDGTAAANGSTITSTHGRSKVINAPTSEGTYKLYIIDEAGNISQASVKTLTVKNVGPVVTIEGPSKTNVQANDTVEYTVTYSADTKTITLGQLDIGLVRTGTANAYVVVSTIDKSAVKKKSGTQQPYG